MSLTIYASVFLLNNDDQILLVKEGKAKNFNLWNLPGGHLEPQEFLEQAAARECLEETGLKALDLKPFHVFEGNLCRYLHFIFHTTSFEGTLKVIDPNIMEAQWFDIELLPSMRDQLLHPDKIILLIDKYQRGFDFNVEFMSHYLK